MMSTRSIYDNWERLVTAVLREQQNWELCHAQSRSPSLLSQASDFSSSRSFHQDDQYEYELPFDFSTERGPSTSPSYPAQQQSQVATFSESIHPRTVFATDDWPAFGYEDVIESPFHVVGEGTYGSVVGTCYLHNGMTIAIKKIPINNSRLSRDFLPHMKVIGNVKHEYVAPLRAYFTTTNRHWLLYDHYRRGSVSELLHGKSGDSRAHVDLETRLKIAIGAAKGISHIHTQYQHGGKKMMVHGNIKASNIFLNSQLFGVVSDLGLAILKAESTKHVSQASDVYSFGILLLQLVTRKSPAGRGALFDLVNWVNSVNRREWSSKLFDQDILLSSTTNTTHVVEQIFDIGINCVAKSAKKRPKMYMVVKMIEDVITMNNNNNNNNNNSSSSSDSNAGIFQVSVGSERNGLVFFGYRDPTFDLEDLLMDSSTHGVANGTFVISYKSILEDGTIISVRKLKDVLVADNEFQKHMEVIGRIGHKYVAQPKAYYRSMEMDECLLVYDSYNQDSLSTWLHGSRGRHLEREMRLKIAMDAARAIAFIHSKDDGKLVHGNITSSNILLSNQLHVTVCEVGLVKLIAPIYSPVLTSSGYCAPEVRDIREVSQASDVFSFGVVLLELLSGKPPLTEYKGKVVHLSWLNRIGNLDWTSHVFGERLVGYNRVINEQMEGLKQIVDCCLEDCLVRPTMAQVVIMLENLTRVNDLE